MVDVMDQPKDSANGTVLYLFHVFRCTLQPQTLTHVVVQALRVALGDDLHRH